MPIFALSPLRIASVSSVSCTEGYVAHKLGRDGAAMGREGSEKAAGLGKTAAEACATQLHIYGGFVGASNSCHRAVTFVWGFLLFCFQQLEKPGWQDRRVAMLV